MTATLELGALEAGLDEAVSGTSGGWRSVCRVEDLEPSWGEAALVEGRQVALFRTGATEVFAVAHQDPATGAHVMARGILGSRGGRPTIASPLHKEVYDLETGECFSTPGLGLATFRTRIADGIVEIEL
jgi:nitrite reductase (NADH) small subunit